jgi:integrase/recombinase XerD
MIDVDMFAAFSVWSRSGVRRKQLEGPLLIQRKQYLDHLLRSGVGRNTIRTTGCYLLHIIRILELTELRTVRESEILLAGKAWVEYRGPFRTNTLPKHFTGRTHAFVSVAKAWFRFHGSLAAPALAPFHELIANFSQAMKSRGLSPNSVIGYTGQVRRFLLWFSSRSDHLATVSIRDVDSYIAMKRAEGLKPRSLAATGQALRSFFNYAETQRWCRSGICLGIHSPRITKSHPKVVGATWGEVRKMLRGTSGGKAFQLRSKAILMLLAIYGLRSSEAAGLLLSDFDWRSEVLTVRRAKRGGIQQYPIQHEVGEAVLSYLQRGRPQCASRLVFVSLRRPHDLLSGSAMWHIVSKRIQDLGIDVSHRGPHALRHSCATRLLQKGCSLQEIADFLGHKSLQTVSVYASFDNTSLRKVAAFQLGGLK